MSWRTKSDNLTQSRQQEQQSQVPHNRWAAAAQQDNQSQRFNQQNENDNEYDSQEDIQQNISATQQRSVESSRRALNKLNVTESIGSSNLQKMSNQSEILNRIETKLDQASQKIKVSDAKADQLKSLNRFFFLPSFGGKKVARIEAEGKAKEIEAKQKIQDSKERQEGRAVNIARLNEQQKSSSRSHGNYHTTPRNVERCAVEEEIDGNLSKMSAGLGRLKLMGQAMNDELKVHDGQLSRLRDKTAIADESVKSATRKVDNISKRG